MEIYVVGGAVRDTLLYREVKDVDYVVVGSTPEQMISMGFVQVGADFPVFLKDGEEYALARTERKSGVGYNGFETTFDPSVTLIDDLERRDLTINSMAVKLENWEEFQQTRNGRLVIDPFFGQADLQIGVLVHTSEAFAEDPVRVLRTARFAARYGFIVNLETHQLMSKVVHELDHVPQERIWAEFAKGLMEDHPERMIAVLQGIHAFSIDTLRPYWKATSHMLEVVKHIPDLAVRFAVIADGFQEEDYERCRIPTECARLSKAVNRFGPHFHVWHLMDAPDRLDVLTQLRVPNDQSFVKTVNAVTALMFSQVDIARRVLWNDLDAISSVDAASIAATCKTGSEIKDKIRNARIQAMSI